MTTLWQRWLLTFLVVLVALAAGDLLSLKFFIANKLYQLEGFQWSLKHHFITEAVLHDGVRTLNLIAVASLLIITLLQFIPGKRGSQKRSYVLLLLSVLLSFGLVNYLKATLGMDCPWDLFSSCAAPTSLLTTLRQLSFAGP